MQMGGLHFTNRLIGEIQATVEAEPELSRRELSRRLCEEQGWRAPNGRLKTMSCRKALVALDRRGQLVLPEVETQYAFEEPGTPPPWPVPVVRGSLEDLGRVTVRLVSSRYARASRTWRSLLEQYHELGSGPLCGAQLRYLVESERYGPLGALAFTSATWALAARDRHIGWSVAARQANLDQVVCNARFLIAPSVEVPNLASHVLGLALARLPEDWELRYGVRPLLVETFVNPRRFRGTSYRAANWIHVGQTSGRRDGIPKEIFVYHMDPAWQEVLCQEPRVPLGSIPRPEAPAHWAEAEFSTVRFYDRRLTRRLYLIAQDFYHQSEAQIPEASGSKARTIAAYRFFQNPAVTMDVLLTAHVEATLDRMREHRVVLAPQDTTTLDYNTHPATEGLGPIGTGGHGLLLHDTLAVTPDGVPLGVLDAQCWAREATGRRRPWRVPPEQRESQKWFRSLRKVGELQRLCPQTMLVSIGDREADIYDLFREAQQDPAGPQLLVRANRERRQVGDQPLWDYMAARRARGVLEVHVPRQGSRRARTAQLALRFAPVTLRPPQGQAAAPPLSLWAVSAREETAPEGVRPIDWLLLTTVPVTTQGDAIERVRWYTVRWEIEVFHHVLKSGCKVRNRQFGTADRLEACLAIDLVVAWRVDRLRKLSRSTPEAPCTVFFTPAEWQALTCYRTGKPRPPAKPPTLAQATAWVAQLGGHLGRKGDGPPGPTVLWRGLQHLNDLAAMYAIMTGSGPRSP